MSIEEFKATAWKPGMTAEWDGETYRVFSVNFGESLVGLVLPEDMPPETDADINWARCENIALI